VSTGSDPWVSGLAVLALLLGYTMAALSLSSGDGRHHVTARRHGLYAGLVVGGAWLAVLDPPSTLLKQWVLVPLAIAMIAPASVAVFTARSTHDRQTATGMAAWTGIVGGLLVFVISVTSTYVRNGRPYDRQLVRDFHASGAHDLATYAITSNVSTALQMLATIPAICIAIGSLAALTSTNQPHPRPAVVDGE
jgi:hypothetical protein